jgi:type IV secretion system protein VirB9
MSSGASALTPLRVFDDGRFTYFQMPAGSETPAIFVLNAHGEEEVVNSQVRGGFTVVDLVADAFVLRFGRDRALVQRSGFEQVDSPVRSRRLRRGRAS